MYVWVDWKVWIVKIINIVWFMVWDWKFFGGFFVDYDDGWVGDGIGWF